MGGMCILDGNSSYYQSVRSGLSKEGAIVVGVQFRNGAGSLGPHPFPAGLNDCMSGLQWVHENRGARNISKVMLLLLSVINLIVCLSTCHLGVDLEYIC